VRPRLAPFGNGLKRHGKATLVGLVELRGLEVERRFGFWLHADIPADGQIGSNATAAAFRGCRSNEISPKTSSLGHSLHSLALRPKRAA